MEEVEQFTPYELQLPFGAPPVLPDVKKQLKNFLLCPDHLPIHDHEQAQKYWPRQPTYTSLYHVDLCPLATTLKVDRDPTTGKLERFREVEAEDVGITAKNSMSLRRAPGPADESVRGNPTNYPFWPGGFPELSLDEMKIEDEAEVDFEKDLLSVPPGFEKGYEIEVQPKDAVEITEQPAAMVEEPKVEPVSVLNLAAILQQEQDLMGLWKGGAEAKEEGKKEPLPDFKVDMDVSEIVPEESNIPVLKITGAAPLKGPSETAWAKVVDVTQPVVDFDQRIPNMARKWPFPLDTFQKQAILLLEEGDNVFVAAHTSAGKTVVAEYAIALAKQHNLRTVYTSPIKALSNQKYKDFKNTFEDVGLITGDIQINQKANCLIMTTEILRSMLYFGSNVIPELDYVIFDEVHYINDAERGHVWEEVLILLPDHVKIVMLSATVPNTLQFADWVGRTKKKMMYVISTLKRPIPLEHFLYTGTGGKTKDDRFLILNADGQFVTSGYNAACDATKKRVEAKSGYGPKGGFKGGGSNPKQEKTMWIGLIDHLQRKEKLPVIAFTLSRNRCDQNADLPTSVDLTTPSEKNKIYSFFQKEVIEHLKGLDKKLPQVTKMQQLLRNGIGIHHSGILPILKEVVEMLFQQGLVKLLFATETFAMGVNVPARTVVFDSITKFDGNEFRTLLPAEYIQMAGRAGRRGLDTTGTVIVLCKRDVPQIHEFQKMMLGKPTALQSKFRLTYSMILNLFRVERLGVEDMMLHSFSALDHQTNFEKNKQMLKKVEGEIAEMNQLEGVTTQDYTEFYEMAEEYFDIRRRVQASVLKQPRVAKEMTPGRVIVITYEDHMNKPGVLLSSTKEGTYKVLVLCSDNTCQETDKIQLSVETRKKDKAKVVNSDWYKFLTLADEELFVPDGVGNHAVVVVKPEDIFGITTVSVKVDSEKVLNDWDKRQIPRFRDDPPGQSCSHAVKGLTEISHNLPEKPLTFINVNDMGHKEMDLHLSLKKTELIKHNVSQLGCITNPNFKQQFQDVFKKMQLEKKRKAYRARISKESLELYPDYCNRVKVLQKLKYINNDNAVEMKGQVACQMGNHELMITELLLESILVELPPPEIAAVLSSLVFQQKTNVTLEEILEDATTFLKQGIEAIQAVAEDLERVEKAHGVGRDDPQADFGDKLNFGLVKVVYEWAKGKPFAEIMQFTDVQEGIIVRCIQQLSETLRDVKGAARIIGEPRLQEKMDEASTAIKRDIVFAASLYTQEDKKT